MVIFQGRTCNLEKLHKKSTCNTLLFQVIYSCLNSCQRKIKRSCFFMSSIKHQYNSSVERHMLGNQKVWGLILSQVVPRFCCSVRIHASFYTEITRENTSSGNGSYTRNVANRISSLTQVYSMCFSVFELVFWTLVTWDKHNFSY